MTAPAGRLEAPKPQGDLIGPWTDALLGYGLAYLLSLPLLLLWANSSEGAIGWPLWLSTLIALGLSAPHYGATILRVYEQRRDRRRYAFFAVWVTAMLAVLFGASLFQATLGSTLLTIYALWSPWHFAGQNFGISLMSLRRRGVEVDPMTRQLLYGSFVLAYALAVIGIQTEGVTAELAVGASGGDAYRVFRAGIPAGPSAWARLAIFSVYALVTITGLVRLARRGGMRNLVPTLLLIATHSLWYVVPALTPKQIPLIYTAVWISAFHSIQYLWITTYYAVRTSSADEKIGAGRFFAKCLLIGSAQNGLIPLFFIPGLLGGAVAYGREATVVFFAVLNIHHFILDGAIWKLRDGRISRILLADGSDRPGDDEVRPRGFVKPAAYLIGALLLLFPIYLFVEVGFAVSSASRPAVEAAAKRLEFVGREHPDVYFVLGQHRQIEGDATAAIEAYRNALAIDPEHAGVAFRLAELLLRPPGDPLEALRLASQAVETTRGQDADALIVLGQAQLRNGRRDIARATFQQALQVAKSRNEAELSSRALRQLSRLGTADRRGSDRAKRR